jgi:hypothetical protein
MFYCAQCKAPVDADAEKCPACGFVFSLPPTSAPRLDDAETRYPSHPIRKLTYFVALCAVGYSSFRLSGPILGFSFGYDVFSHFLGLPAPRILGWDLPLSQNVKNNLSLGLFVIVLRRLGLMVATGFALPWSYSGPLYYLMLVPVWSLILGVTGFWVSILIGAPSGVPAGLLFLPAAYFLASGITLVELLSLWPSAWWPRRRARR